MEKLIEEKKNFVDCQPLCFCFTAVEIPRTYLQAKNMNIHCIHDLMVDNLKSFFSCLIKYKSITNLTSSQLKSFDVESNVCRMKSFYMGQKNHQLIEVVFSL